MRETEGDLGFESSDCRLSDFRLAWCLETYSLLTASHMVQGDFSTPLEMTLGGQGGQTVERCYPLSAVRFPWGFRHSGVRLGEEI